VLRFFLVSQEKQNFSVNCIEFLLCVVFKEKYKNILNQTEYFLF
jgi:hypothetical protein